MSYRIEHDLLGELKIEDTAYYGIHTKRANENFDISGMRLHKELIKALLAIKKAAAQANMETGLLSSDIGMAIISACDEIIAGRLWEHFIVDAFQGGAGTSANMNVNEVIANRAIEILGGIKGNYKLVHPLDHVNMSQSTNDVFPTAVRIAAIQLLRPVSEMFAKLQSALQEKENEFAAVIKVGRTQLQDAVPIFMGQEFGAWAQAISRDRWRIYKAEERLRQINLGGTAVGTGLNADRRYVFLVTEKLRSLTGLGLARSEYMVDATQNNDIFVEVSGLLKTAAVNLSKIASDLRLMASGPFAGFGEIELPKVQAGSSIMPSKVNPVILEAVNQVMFQIMGNDLTITIAAQSGQLELNPFLPLIAHNLFEMFDLMNNILNILINKCIIGIKANIEKCCSMVENSLVTVTALAVYIGYERATEIALKSMNTGKTIREIAEKEGVLSSEELDKALNPLNMTRPFTRKDRKA
jgi:aspartate ammonia-lyase